MNLPKPKPKELNPRLAFYFLVFINFINSLGLGLGISIADLLTHLNELGLTGTNKTHPAPSLTIAFLYVCAFFVVPLILLIPLGLFMVVAGLLSLVYMFTTAVATVFASDKLIIRLTAIPVYILTATSGISLGLGMSGLKIFDLSWMPVFLVSSTHLLAICITLLLLGSDELV